MKKIGLVFMFIFLLSGCDVETEIDDYMNTVEDSLKPEVNCSIETQYLGSYGIGYYIEGSCANNESKDYDYLQVEFICYDSAGNNLGTAYDNTTNLLKGQTWKYKAMFYGSDDEQINHCDFLEVTGW